MKEKSQLMTENASRQKRIARASVSWAAAHGFRTVAVRRKYSNGRVSLNFPARRKSKERMSRKAEIPRKIKTVYGI